MVRPWGTHTFYVYVVQVPQREKFRTRLQQAGIATGIHYPIPIHLQPACAHFGYMRGMLPITETVTEHIVSLPMYPEMTDQQVQVVIDTVRQNLVPAYERIASDTHFVTSF